MKFKTLDLVALYKAPGGDWDAPAPTAKRTAATPGDDKLHQPPANSINPE